MAYLVQQGEFMANQEKFSVFTAPGDGVQTVWDFSFSDIAGAFVDVSKNHVRLYKTDPAGQTTPIDVEEDMWLGARALRILPALPAGHILTIRQDSLCGVPQPSMNDHATSYREAAANASDMSIQAVTPADDALSLLSSIYEDSPDVQPYKRPVIPSGGMGLVSMSLRERLALELDAREFGIVSSSVLDQSELVNQAFAEGVAQGKVVNFGNMCVKLATPVVLPVACPGFKFDTVSYGVFGDPGFYFTGTGTALTIRGSFRCIEGAVYGAGQVANGVYMDNPLLSRGVNLRVHLFQGFGLKVIHMWDSVMDNVSIESCGSATEYAFYIGETNETTNMSVIGRLQVEQSREKAIWISPLVLSCVINNIHSERSAVTSPDTITWMLGGNRTVYNGLRLDASGGVASNALVYFVAANTTFTCALVEYGITAVIDAYLSSSVQFIGPEIQGAFTTQINQTGTINVFGGVLASISGQLFGFRAFGTTISAANIGDNAANPLNTVFNSCRIGSLQGSSANSAVTVNSCIVDGGLMPAAWTRIVNSRWTLAGDNTFGYGRVELNDSEIICGTLTINSAYMRLVNSRIKGNLGLEGNFQSIADYNSFVTGSCPEWAAPVFNTLLPEGAFYVGMRAANITPGIGKPKGWVCVDVLAPWVSEGNL